MILWGKFEIAMGMVGALVLKKVIILWDVISSMLLTCTPLLQNIVVYVVKECIYFCLSVNIFSDELFSNANYSASNKPTNKHNT